MYEYFMVAENIESAENIEPETYLYAHKDHFSNLSIFQI